MPVLVPMPQLPVELWERIVRYHEPSRTDYAVRLPWKQSTKQSTLASLTQVCSAMRAIALPLVWAIVYVETMKDWGILWKRICRESGQHIHTFIQFWAIARLPHLCMDYLQKQGRDLLWYAFINRKKHPLCNRTFTEKDYECDPYRKLGNGPDGYGPDSIIESREMFLQASKGISATWSKRLHTIYWDATTTFPEDVILNIRQIQENCDDGDDDKDEGSSTFPGLQHLCIDYIERSAEEAAVATEGYQGPSTVADHARVNAHFEGAVWKLGKVTLQKLKLFWLAPPFWPNVRVPFRNPATISADRLHWSDIEDGFGKLKKQLNQHDENSGLGRYYKLMQMIRPEVFFTSSQTPFHCKNLLACWARLRCIHIFNMVLLTNGDDTSRDLLHLPRSAEVFHTPKMPDSEYFYVGPKSMMNQSRDTGRFLRGAIQLRPFLERLMEGKGRAITGLDITSHARATQGAMREGEDGEDQDIHWTEDWNYCRSLSEDVVRSPFFQEADQTPQKHARTLSTPYLQWLRDDPNLADEVAEAFNRGVQDYRNGDEKGGFYPFCHSEYPGQVYFEPSTCKSRDDKVWLDRPRHRGSYSKLNVEGFKKKQRRVARRYSPYDNRTLHPYLELFPSYRPSL